MRFPHETGGQSYTYRTGPLENIHRVFQRMELCSRNRGLPCVEKQFALAQKGQHVEMSCVLAVG